MTSNLLASVLLVAMPGAPSSFLFLVRPGAPSSVRTLLVAMPGAPSSFLFLNDPQVVEKETRESIWAELVLGRASTAEIQPLKKQGNATCDTNPSQVQNILTVCLSERDEQ